VKTLDQIERRIGTPGLQRKIELTDLNDYNLAGNTGTYELGVPDQRGSFTGRVSYSETMSLRDDTKRSQKTIG
jgi:hypothetical protein